MILSYHHPRTLSTAKSSTTYPISSIRIYPPSPPTSISLSLERARSRRSIPNAATFTRVEGELLLRKQTNSLIVLKIIMFLISTLYSPVVNLQPQKLIIYRIPFTIFPKCLYHKSLARILRLPLVVKSYPTRVYVTC